MKSIDWSVINSIFPKLGTSNEDSANAIYNGVDDSWSKSHVESGSHGGWHEKPKHEDHWGHKEGNWPV